MKKILYLSLLVLLVICVSGCGKEENKINSDSKLAAAKKVMTENLDNYSYDARQLLKKLCPKYGVADEDRLVVLTKLQSIRKPDPDSTWGE